MFLHLIDSPNKGIGVATKIFLSAGTYLGRYTGRALTTRNQDSTNSYIIAVRGVDTRPGDDDDSDSDSDELPVYWIDGRNANNDPTLVAVAVRGNEFIEADEQQTNWTRYVNSVSPSDYTNLAVLAKDPQNVEYVERNLRVYLYTTRAISAGEELLVNYGESFFLVNFDDTVLIDARTAHIRGDVLRRRILNIVGYTEDKERIVANIVSNFSAPSSLYTIRFLYENDRRSDVGVVIMYDTRIQFIASIEVQNWREIRARLMRTVMNRVYLLERDAVTAALNVFAGNDALAHEFGFHRVRLGGHDHAAFYARPVPQIAFAEPHDYNDVRDVLQTRDLDCPEIRKYSDTDFFVNAAKRDDTTTTRRRSLQRMYHMRIGSVDGRRVSTMFTRGDGASRYVAFICAFYNATAEHDDDDDTVDGANAIKRHNLAKTLEQYERYIISHGGTEARVVALKSRQEDVLRDLHYVIVSRTRTPPDIEFPLYEDFVYATRQL